MPKARSWTAKKARKPLSRQSQIIFWFILCGLVVFGIEAGAQILYYSLYQQWRYQTVPVENFSMFERHPYLVGSPKPNARTNYYDKQITHNRHGTRGPDFEIQKAPGTKRIVTLGGSSTYGVLVGDEDTWPVRLANELGQPYQVINLGVPGYSSAENLIQTGLLLTHFQPDIALYYLGWNDLRNIHVKGLKSDYSNFHPKTQFQGLQLVASEDSGRSAFIYFIRRWLVGQLIPQPEGDYHIDPASDAYTDKIDPYALSLFERNVREIVVAARAMGIRVVFAPQLLNYDTLTADQPYHYIPYVKQKDLRKMMTLYNDRVREIARAHGAEFIEDIRSESFSAADFRDQGHFNEAGGQKFAKILAEYFKKTSR